jgi:hypothetical protein
MTAREGLATAGPRDGVEVWTTCWTCAAPVRLLGQDWHHEDGADHPVTPVDDRATPGVRIAHAYALADLLAARGRSHR